MITISKLLFCICLNFQNRHKYDSLKPVMSTFLNNVLDWKSCLWEDDTTFSPTKNPLVRSISLYFHLAHDIVIGQNKSKLSFQCISSLTYVEVRNLDCRWNWLMYKKFPWSLQLLRLYQYHWCFDSKHITEISFFFVCFWVVSMLTVRASMSATLGWKQQQQIHWKNTSFLIRKLQYCKYSQP